MRHEPLRRPRLERSNWGKTLLNSLPTRPFMTFVERAVPTAREEAPTYADTEHVIRRRGSFLLALSLAAPNAQSLRAFAAALEQFESPALVMIVVDSSARAPDGPAKDAIRDVTVRLQHRIAAFAYVVEGESFGAAAVRGAISFIGMFARYSFPQRVMASVHDAGAWLFKERPANGTHPNDPREIVRLIDEMRKELCTKAPERGFPV